MSEVESTAAAAVDDAGPRGLAAVFGPTINAVFAPSKAFEALAARPVLAIWPVIWTVLGAATAGYLNVDITRQTMRIGMIESMAQRGQEMDPERLRSIVEGMDRWAPMFATVGNLFLVLFTVIFAVAFWIGSSLSGGSTKFSSAFAVAAVGAVITPLLAVCFVTLVWQINPPEFRRMAEFYAATPTLSLDLFARGGDASIAVHTLLQRFDLFNLWWVAVSALGCRKLLELRSGAAYAIPIVIWLLSAVIVSGWAWLGT